LIFWQHFKSLHFYFLFPFFVKGHFSCPLSIICGANLANLDIFAASFEQNPLPA